MNSLNFDVKPSPESNDHQVRILIDEKDWLGKDYLGLDPPEFFRQKTLFEKGELIVGRCSCGVVGCCDVLADVDFSNGKVIWKTNNETLIFDENSYLNLLKESIADFSWEDLGRKVERLVSEIFDKKLIENKYKFDWASTRIQPKIIKLSFSNNGEQKLYQFKWDGKTLDSAIENAKLFYSEYFK